MFIIIVFWLGSDKPSGLLFSCLFYFFLYSRLYSYSHCLFLNLISFLLFPCARVWENTRAQVPQFPIARLNGIYLILFRETSWSKWSKSRLSKTNYSIIIIYIASYWHGPIILGGNCILENTWFPYYKVPITGLPLLRMTGSLVQCQYLKIQIFFKFVRKWKNLKIYYNIYFFSRFIHDFELNFLIYSYLIN